MELLVVCTGNICRSPMAEGLFEHAFASRGVEDWNVSSVGLLTEDRPASEFGVAAMARRGIDIGAHRSRRLTSSAVEAADVVVGMERQHVREAAVIVEGAFTRCFTLPDLARRANRGGPRRDEEPVAGWLDRIGAGRQAADLLGIDPGDEIADPIGGSARDYERTAERLEALIATVVANLAPSPAT